MNSHNNNDTAASAPSSSLPPHPPLIGVLALQGAFEEHQKCLEAIGCRTVQVRTPKDLENLDGIVLPGGESTAMGLIGTTWSNTTSSSSSSKQPSMWDCLRNFGQENKKPMWGTCAGMILLAEQCVGTSAVIENGQALIGGMNVLVCRNYFGSQVSSFEMPTPPPPSPSSSLSTAMTAHSGDNTHTNDDRPFPGIFIRAPAILSAGPDVEVLGRVVATPCRQAAVVLQALEDKMSNDTTTKNNNDNDSAAASSAEEKKGSTIIENVDNNNNNVITLPGAAADTGARQVICAVRRENLLCTAFHPELTDDYRWHEYFVQQMVLPHRKI